MLASMAIPAAARPRSLRALLDGRAAAGAVGSPFWETVQNERLVPQDALVEIWTSPPFNHCMFTARVDLDLGRERQFAKALVEMNYDNPDHRPILEAEGLRKWIPPQLDGYQSLREASAAQGLL